MTDTIRERITEAARAFDALDAVVLTTFNLSVPFLEDHALPAALSVDGETPAARRAAVHQRLGTTACAVFYDPSVPPRLTGRFRYVARPVPLRGRLFHPKLVVLAGRVADEPRVYLAVSSANLTLSGWGRNAESFGEIWIRARGQQPWAALRGLLSWLQQHAGVGERPDDSDAVARTLLSLDRMPGRLPRGADHPPTAWLYASVVHGGGLPGFLRMGRARRPSEVRVYSPYWADVADQVKAFAARETVLVPALRADGAGVGLARGEAAALGGGVSVRANAADVGDRFWHLKAYRVVHGTRTYTAVGSCNFTRAGLSGAAGNVEAMLVFEADPAWLPAPGAPLTEFPEEVPGEEEAPEPAPACVVVAWDWREPCWRWWLDPGPRQTDFTLHLPGNRPIPVGPGRGEAKGQPPPRAASFTVAWRVGDGARRWTGQVIELNLEYSSRSYGRALSASDILESWRGRAPTWDIAGGGGAGDGAGEDEGEAPAAFDAVNLYDLYRSLRGLRARLRELAEHPDALRAHLVGRPDSVLALAYLADGAEAIPVVRYLVLTEVAGVVDEWSEHLDADLRARVREMASRAAAKTRGLLRAELGVPAGEARAMLRWVEQRLRAFDSVAP